MKKVLNEKILLEEPEETLPDAIPSEPITVSVEDEANKQQMTNDMLVNTLTYELNSVYDNVTALKGILTTIGMDAPERTDIMDIINSIIDERTIHIGMLQKAIDLIDVNHETLVKTGEEKASDIASETSNDLNKEE